MSHLACSDEPDNPLNRQQLERFRAVAALFPGVPASLANSGGVFLGPDYHFAHGAAGHRALRRRCHQRRARIPMRPVVTLEARVLAVRDAQAGETVGYGATRTLTRPSLHRRRRRRLCRRLSPPHRHRDNPARVFVRGRFAPLAGRVSMDLITIDVTDVPGVQRGDWVELFGAHVPVDEAAGHAGTIGYEFLTGLGRRYHRVYRGLAGKPLKHRANLL